MNKNYGSAITQYIIILGIVGFVVLITFALLGKNIVGFFTEFKEGLKAEGTSVAQNVDTTKSTPISLQAKPKSETKTTGGELGGTIDSPVRKCSGDTCSIDYGEFTLTGIPADFQEFVKSAGNSGGTENILSVLDQLIEQIEDTSDPDEINLLKELSNLGHALAATEVDIEDTARNLNYKQVLLSDIFQETQVLSSHLRELQMNKVRAFKDKYQEVIDKYSSSGNMTDQQILAITSTLSDEIIVLSEQINEYSGFMMNEANSLIDRADAQGYDYSKVMFISGDGNGNFNSGDVISASDIHPSANIDTNLAFTTTGNGMKGKSEGITNPESKDIINLDSALICRTGRAEDYGNECH